MTQIRKNLVRLLAACGAVIAVMAAASAEVRHKTGLADSFPWLDEHLSPDRRAELVVARMTLDEKIQLVHSRFGTRNPQDPPPQGPNDEVGYVAGIPRLGIPALHIDDGSLGVANAWSLRDNDEATALPSALALAATWNPTLAFTAGAAIGDEARRKGFNVLLAGSVNLLRDPHNGRGYEYAGEDPVLAGIMVGANIRGIQSQHVVSTVKHFAVNDWETGRWNLSGDIDERALRESDLRAFQIAIEHGDPGAVMCAYNKVNGVHACESRFLLDTVLRADWGYRGWVMSDWGAVHGTVASAIAGLDQESGDDYDTEVFYGAPLKAAVERGEVPAAQLDRMVRRILRNLFAIRAFDARGSNAAIDYAAHGAIARRIAEEGMVLLKNEGGLLPLSREARDIVVIGSHADIGVLSGGGSSQVRPVGGPALVVPPAPGMPKDTPQIVWFRSPPLAAMKAEAPNARIAFADGDDVAAAAELAAHSAIAVVFAHQWMTEGFDAPSLSLPDDQDRLIAAVAAANPRTIVVLETGGPVLMPWLDQVGAVLEAWYPGQHGGEAIARILFGTIAPSGRLPVSFPRDEAQLPPSAQASAKDGRQSVVYSEGAKVGYRWFEAKKEKPLFPFGYGLTYTRFAYAKLQVAGGERIRASFTVTNDGARAGTEIAQLYVTLPEGDGRSPRRLAAWKRVALRPGTSQRVAVVLDRHALEVWNSESHVWEKPAGPYRIDVSASATDDRLRGDLDMPAVRPSPAVAKLDHPNR
jgi:beta-glucosidase